MRGGKAAWCLLLAVVVLGADEGELDGVMEPYEVVDISSQVPGILDEVAVERGDRVEKEQVVARLKDGLERIAVELARARVAFNRRQAERSEDLYASQLVSLHEKDRLETEIQLNQLQVEEARERLAMRTIRSPLQGVVTQRFYAPGEYVGVDPILTIARLDPLHVEVIVPLERWGSIVEGMRAEVRPEDPVGGVYTGEVVIVDQVVDAASGTFGVRVELPNPDQALPAGLKCKVRFVRP